MGANHPQFTQSNILYGSGDAGKQKALDHFLASHKGSIVHVYGEEKGIGIDDIHEARRRAYISGGSNIQVFIIWRADEMTHEARQALLKIFEEPPLTAVFFLLSRSLFWPFTFA